MATEEIDYSKYTCTKKNMQYTIISDEIKKDFDFLLSTGSMGQKLDEMLNYLNTAAGITNAFYFENGGSVQDINHVYEEIKKLQPRDTLQLLLDAKTEDEKSFYEMIGDFLLQIKQREVVERNLF